jgi:D-lactate dehydrogenase
VEAIAYGVLADEEPLLRDAFNREFAGRHELRCLGLFLNRDTVPTAAGHEVVLSSVNDTLDAEVLRALAKGGTRMIAQRATGYNNIDLTAAEELGLTVARVSYYSPYSVAEFAWALALAVDRRIVRAAHRTREFDFRLDRLTVRDPRPALDQLRTRPGQQRLDQRPQFIRHDPWPRPNVSPRHAAAQLTRYTP